MQEHCTELTRLQLALVAEFPLFVEELVAVFAGTTGNMPRDIPGLCVGGLNKTWSRVKRVGCTYVWDYYGVLFLWPAVLSRGV